MSYRGHVQKLDIHDVRLAWRIRWHSSG